MIQQTRSRALYVRTSASTIPSRPRGKPAWKCNAAKATACRTNAAGAAIRAFSSASSTTPRHGFLECGIHDREHESRRDKQPERPVGMNVRTRSVTSGWAVTSRRSIAPEITAKTTPKAMMRCQAADGEPTGCFAKPGHAGGDHAVNGERQPEHRLLRAETCQTKPEARDEQKTEGARSLRTPLPRDDGQRKRRHPCRYGRAAWRDERDHGKESRECKDERRLMAQCARAR